MTSILDQWKSYRARTHRDYEADLIGDKMAEEIERLHAALDPNQTKYAYSGEVYDTNTTMGFDEDGELDEITIRAPVSWTSVKDIMSMIKRRAGVD